MLIPLRWMLYTAVVVSVTGVSATPGIGTARIDVSIPVTGVSASPSIGTVTITEDEVVNVTGVTANAQIGTVTISGAGSGINYKGFGEPLKLKKEPKRKKLVPYLANVYVSAKPPALERRGFRNIPTSIHIGMPITFVPDPALSSVRNTETLINVELSDEELLAILQIE